MGPLSAFTFEIGGQHQTSHAQLRLPGSVCRKNVEPSAHSERRDLSDQVPD